MQEINGSRPTTVSETTNSRVCCVRSTKIYLINRLWQVCLCWRNRALLLFRAINRCSRFINFVVIFRGGSLPCQINHCVNKAWSHMSFRCCWPGAWRCLMEATCPGEEIDWRRKEGGKNEMMRAGNRSSISPPTPPSPQFSLLCLFSFAFSLSLFWNQRNVTHPQSGGGRTRACVCVCVGV